MKDTQDSIPEPRKIQRPVILIALCLFSWVFFAVIALLFLTSLFFSGWITKIIHTYTPENFSPHTIVVLFSLAGFLLHAVAFSGVILMWKMKISGFIIFAISVLLIAVYQMFQGQISLPVTLTYIVLLLLFGLFFKRFS
ncbi:MAG: hypothetical protein Q8867_06870 [Bacteroidota bacterium]|nr:hypothetical protein [Bacteroidota bacterium]